MATRDGDAGTVCAAASRAHGLGPQLRLGRLEREHVKYIWDTDCS